MENYSLMKLEFPALKWALSEKSTVFTDNNPFSHFHAAKLGATEQRWAAQLSPFDFVVKYCPW